METHAELIPHEAVDDLVARAKDGDKDAFGQLYLLHRARVARMARFSLRGDPDDVVAEVFVRAWVALPRYRATGAPFVSWLYGIARHVVWDEMARSNRTRPEADLPERGVEEPKDDRLAIAEAMGKLPTEQRQVIEMKFLIGMRNPEVASLLGITPGAVNAKQWRALVALHGFMEEDA
ncbi:MAG: polymerase sigma-70 factor, subfamily [Actinomycetota bacterium]|nr:polymerase sigma-70 factor, subfamily [Actinomycetota bacterium]